MPINWNDDCKHLPEARDDYAGRVLKARHFGVHATSSDYEAVFAKVWTGTEVRVVQIGTVSYGSEWTRGYAGQDATPEVVAAAEAWTKARDKAQDEDDRARRLEAQRKAPHVDARVRVTQGRTRGKAPIETGTEDTVGRVSADRTGVQLRRSGVWIDWSRVSVVEPAF